MNPILLSALLVAQLAQADAGPAPGRVSPKSQRRIKIVEAPFEIHSCQMNHAHAKPDDGPDVIDIREVLASDKPLIVPKSSQLRIGEALWSPTAKAPYRKFKNGARSWSRMTIDQPSGRRGSPHAMGQRLTYMERDSDGNLHIRRASFRIPKDASPREGGGIKATFFTFFEWAETDDGKESTLPVSLFLKLLQGDKDVEEFFTKPLNDQQQVDDEGLEFESLATLGPDGRSVTLDPYCVKLVQVVDREKVPGISLPVGKPTVVVDRIITRFVLTPDSMALIHIPSEKEREGGHPLLLVVTAAAVGFNEREGK